MEFWNFRMMTRLDSPGGGHSHGEEGAQLCVWGHSHELSVLEKAERLPGLECQQERSGDHVDRRPAHRAHVDDGGEDSGGGTLLIRLSE